MLKSFKKYIVIIFTLLVIPLPVFSQTNTEQPSLNKILSNIYNCYFSSAKKDIQTIIDSTPESPTGYMLRGIYNEWYQLTRNKGTSLNNSIMMDYEKAKELAEIELQKDKSNADLKVLLGNAYMYVAKKQLDNGKKMAAGSSLKKATKIMEEVTSVAPNNHNTYFAIGLFNYFAENVPSGLKWLAALLGFRGDKNKGINYISKAALSSTMTQFDAKFMMMYIYARKENNFSGAMPYAQELSRKFPNNPIFLFNYAEMLFRTKQINESREHFNKLFTYCTKNKNYCSNETMFLSNLFMAWSYIDEKNYTSAKEYVIAADALRQFAGTKDRIERIDSWKKQVM